MKRCDWATTELSIPYHDEEWGRPLHDDSALFEFVTLEGAQAGLSWETILRKRDAYRRAFHDFDIQRVARITPRGIEKLMGDASIVRNRGKIESTVSNARAALEAIEEFGSFDAFVWRFVDGKPVVNTWKTRDQLPGETPASKVMSKELQRRGFRFVGPTICYAFMQAVGMVNDHMTWCDWYKKVQR